MYPQYKMKVSLQCSLYQQTGQDAAGTRLRSPFSNAFLLIDCGDVHELRGERSTPTRDCLHECRFISDAYLVSKEVGHENRFFSRVQELEQRMEAWPLMRRDQPLSAAAGSLKVVPALRAGRRYRRKMHRKIIAPLKIGS